MPYSEITKRHRSVFDPSHMSAVKNHRAPGIRDFEILKPISRGAFGQVYLAKKKGSKTYYAVKSMKKKDVLTKNMMEQVVVERDALAISSKSPYVVQLFYSFQSDEKIFLVMEYMIGGDLKSLLHNLGYFDVEMAKIYIAEVTLALEYLHKHNIYHRDIKPDNMLLSNQGHIKLTDFGLSCLTSDRKPNIVDLINTPGIMSNNNISSKKKIFWRTPGQLQSLTSNFTFSAPKSKEPSSAAPRSRLDTLDSVSSLQSTNYKFSPPKFCPGDIKNSFISTPRGTRQSSSIKNRTGITFEIHSLGIAPPQRKRSHADIESPLDDEKENSAPQKRTRLVSHSLPDIDLPTDFQASSSPVVRFDDSVKNCNYTDRSGVFEVSRIDNVSGAQNTSDINISGVAMMTDSHLASTFYETAVTDTSHMSISVYKTPHTEPCNTSVSILNTGDHFKSPQQPSTSKIELTPSPNKQTPLLTPTYSRTRVSSAVIKTPVQNLQFSDTSPISSPIKSSPDVEHHEKIDRTPEIYNKNTSSLKEVQSENIEKTPDFEVKQTPYRTPKSCVRGRATPMERKAIFGTPDYLAPEILLGIPHGSAVDWWALGVCFYEFLVGVPPFNDDTPELVFKHILEYDIQWPEGDEELPRICVEAIYAMLTEDPGKRVTSVEIKKMSCFDDIAWNSLDTAEAPFIPQPDDECDTGYFTARNLANHLQMSNFNT